MLTVKIVFTVSWVIIRNRVNTHPQTQPRIIVSCTIVVQPRFFVKLLGIEEIRRIPRVVALFDKYFAEWHVLDVLSHLTVQVRDVT